MGKRYYCDYCERAFIDDIQARKKHLLGLKHTLRVKQHYDSFKDPKTILSEEHAKTPCHKYQRTGDCSFGLNCRHSHMTQEKLYELSQEVHKIEEEERRKLMEEERKITEQLSQDPGLPKWLMKKKRRVNPSAGFSTKEINESEQDDEDECIGIEDPILTNIILGGNFSSTSHQNILNQEHLPPSLQPLTINDLMNATWEEWG